MHSCNELGNGSMRPSKSSNNNVERNTWLKKCLEHGLLVETVGNTDSGSYYRWSHDKVQEAALALIQPGKFDLFAYLICV